ncbi:MAG: recombinase family protein [Janthinobacterium lividum]
MKISGPVRYAIYLRCSSDDAKHGDFTTTDAQRDLNMRRIAETEGKFAGEYMDEGKTGTNLNRPAWKRLLADAQAGKFDRVCVTYMSRLGRGNAFTIGEHELRKCGVGVELVQEKFTDDLAGYITKQTTVMMDGLYPRMVSQWTRTKQQEMVARGYFTGGLHPFGYMTIDAEDGSGFHKQGKAPPKRLTPDPEQAPFVQGAFETLRETGSTTEACNYLKRITGREWRLNTVTHILSNRVYLGELHYGQNSNLTAHPPIVSEELFEACQTVRRTRPQTAKKDLGENREFYLRGRIYCQSCGGRLTPASHHGRISRTRYYECLCDTRRVKLCPVKRVNADSIHEAIVAEVKRAVEHPTRMQEIIRDAVKAIPVPANMDDQIKTVTRRLNSIEKETGNLTGAIAKGGAGLRPLLKKIGELENERLGLEVERERLEAQIRETDIQRPDLGQVQAWWGEFVELWDAATDEERQRLVPLLVERVEITEKERGFCRLVFTAQKPRSRSLAHHTMCYKTPSIEREGRTARTVYRLPGASGDHSAAGASLSALVESRKAAGNLSPISGEQSFMDCIKDFFHSVAWVVRDTLHRLPHGLL